MLLLSPCKVRNYIETELGVPQTEVHNKSKSTLSQANCTNLDIIFKSSTKEKSNVKYLPIISPKFEVFFETANLATSYILPQEKKKVSAYSTPLYILYQNFKDYL